MLNKTALLSLLLSLYSFDAHAAEDLDLPPANEIREVCEYIGGLKSFSHGIGRGFLDINNDQKLEKISFITSGTMNIPIPQYEDMQGDEVRVNSINFEWKTFGATSYAWFPYKHNYVVGIKNWYGYKPALPSYVSYINSNNEEYWLCSFKRNVEVHLNPRFSPNSSKSERDIVKKICEKSKNSELDYIELQNLEQKNVKFNGPFHSKVIADIEVDYNNDGALEKLIYVDQASGAGRGCDASFFSEYRENGVYEEPYPITVLHELQQTNPNVPYPTSCTQNTAKWFKYEGRTYLEFRGREKLYWIGIVEEGKPKQVCNSWFHWTYEVDQYSKVVK